jgi:FtsZ-binding cell division protein ZapB
MHFLATSTFGFVQAVSAAAVIAAIVGGIAAVRKMGPEKDSLFITSAQGAAVIMDNLISTLREEVDRERQEVARLTAENERLERENKGLREETEGLRKRGGTRRNDRE